MAEKWDWEQQFRLAAAEQATELTKIHGLGDIEMRQIWKAHFDQIFAHLMGKVDGK